LISWTHADPLGAFWDGLGREFSHRNRAWRSIEATRRLGKDEPYADLSRLLLAALALA
jgi:hypothetical protein